MAFKSSGSGGGFVSKGSGGGFKSKVLPPTGPAIVTDNLIAWLDASNNSSYPGSGTTIYDLSGQGADGTINGTVSWSSNGQASYWNFATQNDSNYISSVATANYADFTIVFEPDFSLGSVFVGLLATGAPFSFQDMSLRFYGANGVGPWQCPNPGNSNDWRTSAGTWYINGTGYTSSLPTLASGWNILGATRDNNNSAFGSPWAYHVGTSGYPGRNLQGKIAVVLLYSAPLTQQQQEQNFNALKSRFGL